jgi:Fn3 associated
VYPSGDTLYKNETIKIESNLRDAEIFYTMNSSTIPTSFTGIKYDKKQGIILPDGYNNPILEIMCVAVCPGKLES